MILFAILLTVGVQSNVNQHDVSVNAVMSGVVRIETGRGKGTGFVVATSAESGTAEIWTNAHVAGMRGTELSIVWFPGTMAEQRTRGRVWTSEKSGMVDRAKISARLPKSKPVFALAIRESNVATSGMDGGLFACGYPRGGWCYALPISPVQSNVNFGTTHRPTAIPGQSGSPVFDRLGNVIGVQTFRVTDANGKKYGVFLPIEHWLGYERQSIPLQPNVSPIGLAR